MDIEKRIALVKEVGEEIVTEDELRELFGKKEHPVAYDGFEPSGNVHIAQGILRAINVNKMLSAGCGFKMFVADWHAWANNKMGGDLEKIHTVGEYLIEVWKACGMDTGKVEFVWGSSLAKDTEYWKRVMQIARNSTLQRVLRCSQIMGRSEKDSLSAAQIFYPCMQAADIFYLGVDIAQLGMDQRKVNMLAREIGPKLGLGKPVAVHHHMLMGLSAPPDHTALVRRDSAVSSPTGNSILKGEVSAVGDGKKDAVERAIAMKMSKSKPDSAIFMTDSEEQISQKIRKSYCPAGIAEDNPLMEYSKYIIFEKFKSMKIVRLDKFGGTIEAKSFGELKEIYTSGKLHPEDLKAAVAHYVNELVKPVREHFEKDKKAHKLLEEIKSFEVTR